MAHHVVGNLYKHSAWPQLRKGAVICRAHQFLQMMDAQRAKQRWEKPQGQKPCFSWRWGEVRFFAMQSCFLLSRLWSCTSNASSVARSGKKMVFPCRDAAVVGYVRRQCVSHFFIWFQRGSAGSWPPSFTCSLTKEQPFPGKSCCASALWAWQLIPWDVQGHIFTSLSLSHSETPVLLWVTHYPTIGSFFLEIQTRKLKVFPNFLLLIFLMEQALDKPGHLTCEE